MDGGREDRRGDRADAREGASTAAAAAPPERAASRASGTESAIPAPRTTAVLLAWAALAGLLVVLAWPNRTAPGLNYDEAALAGLARDLLSGHVRAEHVPTASTIVVGGRPLPWVMAGYYGALKSWMFAPVFATFGATAATLRMASLGWGLVALLFAMLWASRLAGTAAGIATGALLALDPSFFFIVVHDWGPAVPGFVCRFAGLLLSLLAWRSGRASTAFAAGAAFGLAFWAKIDSAVPIACWALAAAIAWPERLRAAQGERRGQLLALAAGLVVGAFPMLLNLRGVLGAITEFGGGDPRQWIQKPGAFVAMFDGSYFDRLMRAGGNFEHMWEKPAAFRTPWGLVVAAALAVLARAALRARPDGSRDRLARFVLLGCLSVLVALWAEPNASFLHHWTVAYPFPHLAVAIAAVRLLEAPPEGRVAAAGARRAAGAAAAAAIAIALAGDLLAIGRTQRTIAASGGKGLWSDALHRFAAEIDGHPEIRVVSLDWGFNEQLAFLTDGPRLEEPVWRLQRGETIRLDPDPNTIYLLHPEAWTILPWAREKLLAAGAIDPARDDIREYEDREGDVAFLAIRLR